MILSLLAVLAVVAVTSASASALETRYVAEGKEVTTAETYSAVVGVAQLNSTIGSVKIMIECSANALITTGANAIEAEGKSSGEISFSQCVIYEIKKGSRVLLSSCTITEPIKFAFKDLLVSGPGGLLEDEYKPSTGTIFVEITIGVCVLKGTYKAEGAYTASFGAEGEREVSEHELLFHSTGSKVTLGKEPASFTNTISRIKLKSGKSWYAG